MLVSGSFEGPKPPGSPGCIPEFRNAARAAWELLCCRLRWKSSLQAGASGGEAAAGGAPRAAAGEVRLARGKDALAAVTTSVYTVRFTEGNSDSDCPPVQRKGGQEYKSKKEVVNIQCMQIIRHPREKTTVWGAGQIFPSEGPLAVI